MENIPDDDRLYRKIKRIRTHVTRDYVSGKYVLHPSALRYDKGLMSTHLHSILEYLGRVPESLYPMDEYASVGFFVVVPRNAGEDVIHCPATVEEEADEDLRQAHCDVTQASKAEWNVTRSMIIESCWWVQEYADPDAA